MARDFKALVRINDWVLDQKRRSLGELVGQLDNLEGLLAALEAEIVREQAMASQSPIEAGLTYGNYAAEAVRRREALQRRIADKETEILDAREALREAFLEFKKYEIAEDRRQARVDAELLREERQELDEIGLMAHIRKD